MGFHTFDPARANQLEDEGRYRFCSRDELLGLLEPHDGMVVADLGSGTGFYADDVAEYVGTLYAVDVQEEMHAYYREKGLPENVEPVTAPVEDLPFGEGELDAAFSIDTYHEYHSDASLRSLSRALRPGGRVVTVDWSAGGERVSGPPLEERYSLADAVAHFSAAGFRTVRAEERAETFIYVAQR